MQTMPDLQNKTPEELLEIIKSLHSENANLRHQLNQALRQRFGRKSEKLDDNQLSIFDEIKAPENKHEIEKTEAVIRVAGHTRRRKTGKKPLPQDLPRIQHVHDLPEAEKTCDCGCALTHIGEVVTEQLDIIPAKVQVIQHVRRKYACKACEETIKTAKAPKQPIPKSIASPGLLAHVAVSKFCDHLPLYRQEKILQRMKVDIARNTLSHWMIKVGDLFRPLYKYLIYHMTQYDIAYADETRVQVLKEDGRPAEAQSFMWCFIGGPPDKRGVVYHYNPGRAHTVILELLEDFKGYLHCDGYGAYDTYARVAPSITLVACWMHARRKFYEVAQSSKTEGLAHAALAKISALYKLEKEAKESALDPNAIYQMRQQNAKPILDDFKIWLDENSLCVPPKSPLGQAIGYALNQWQKLIQYLKDGRLEIDNGLTERQIKPFVIGRKNWMFYQSIAGVRAAEVIYSIIETAKLNGLEPYSYLRHLLTHMPSITTELELEKLLPFNLKSDSLAN